MFHYGMIPTDLSIQYVRTKWMILTISKPVPVTKRIISVTDHIFKNSLIYTVFTMEIIETEISDRFPIFFSEKCNTDKKDLFIKFADKRTYSDESLKMFKLKLLNVTQVNLINWDFSDSLDSLINFGFDQLGFFVLCIFPYQEDKSKIKERFYPSDTA